MVRQGLQMSRRKDLKRRAKQIKAKRKRNKAKESRLQSERDWNEKTNRERTEARERARQMYRDAGMREEWILNLLPYEEDNVF
jgi:hypothetical protein